METGRIVLRFHYLQGILVGGGSISQRCPDAGHVNSEFALAAMPVWRARESKGSRAQ